MPRLRVRELAEAMGLNMSQLQRQSGVTMPSVRRYWYNTRDGKSQGEAIREVDLEVLAAIARVLEVEVRDLIEDGTNKGSDTLGNSLPMPLAA
jgi:transcriptional regulator with XRE-family HTH domain